MEFKPVDDECYYYCRYYKKYYQIVEATQYGIGLVDIKVRECELKFDRMEVRPVDPKNSKEFVDEEVYKMIPFGRKKKFCYATLRIYELQDKYIYKKKKD